MILTHDWNLYEKVLREVGHPVRQAIGGAGDAINYASLSVRPHPMTAIMLLSELRSFDPLVSCHEFEALAGEIAAHEGVRLIGMDSRRQNAAGKVPVALDGDICDLGRKYNIVPSGAFDLASMEKTARQVYLISETGGGTND